MIIPCPAHYTANTGGMIWLAYMVFVIRALQSDISEDQVLRLACQFDSWFWQDVHHGLAEFHQHCDGRPFSTTLAEYIQEMLVKWFEDRDYELYSNLNALLSSVHELAVGDVVVFTLGPRNDYSAPDGYSGIGVVTQITDDRVFVLEQGFHISLPVLRRECTPL